MFTGSQSEASTSEEQPELADSKIKAGGSWAAKETGRKPQDADYLRKLGQADYNINVDHGAQVSLQGSRDITWHSTTAVPQLHGSLVLDLVHLSCEGHA